MNRKLINTIKISPFLCIFHFKSLKIWFNYPSGLLSSPSQVAFGLACVFPLYNEICENTEKCMKKWLWRTSDIIYSTSRTLSGLGFIAFDTGQRSLRISLKQRKYTKNVENCLGTDLKIYEFPTITPSGLAHRVAHMYVQRPRPWYIANAISAMQ